MERIKENMNLIDFINEFVCPNSIIRLWKPSKEGYGHEMLCKRDPSKPGNLDEVDMEWKFQQNKTWRCKYNNCKVIGVNDILTNGHCREAINIVIDPDVHIYPDSFELPNIEKEKHTYLLMTYGGYDDPEFRKKFALKPLQYKIIISYLTEEELIKKFKDDCEFIGVDYNSMNLKIKNMKNINTINYVNGESKKSNIYLLSRYGSYEQPEYQYLPIQSRQNKIIIIDKTEEELEKQLRETCIQRGEDYDILNLKIKNMKDIKIKDYTKSEN